jgi:hypothetical protein
VLGASVPAALHASALWIPYTGGGSYTVPLTDLKIDGRSVGAPASRYFSTIVDSGTTFMYVMRSECLGLPLIASNCL